MKPTKLYDLMKQGRTETCAKGQVFYALDFKAELYVVTKGYVKRYQITEDNRRIIESIYGPSYFFPLSQVFKDILLFELSQENVRYVYEAMTDIELQGIRGDVLEEAVEKDPVLYKDLLYEAGRRLQANINRLASNAIHDDYKKVAHQLVFLAEEFGKMSTEKGVEGIRIQAPLSSVDMAEQLNISLKITEAIMASLEKHGLITTKGSRVFIPDIHQLKDAYLLGATL